MISTSRGCARTASSACSATSSSPTPNAIVASRIFDFLAYQPVPESAGIGDVAFLTGLGYRTFMFGDKVCFLRDSTIEALNLLEAVAGEF